MRKTLPRPTSTPVGTNDPVDHRRSLALPVSLALSFGVLCFSGTATAQSVDPCLEILSGGDLGAYDAAVASYFDALDADDATAQLQALEEVSGICDANLKIDVLRAHALSDQGDCPGAAAAYLSVLDRAPTWPHADNASEATTDAREGLGLVRDACVATVNVTCGTDGAQVIVGDRAPAACSEPVEVPSGETTVTVTAAGMTPISRQYTFAAGNNFVEIEALSPLTDGGQVTVTCATPGTVVTVGGQPVACGGSVVVPVGQSQVSATRPNGSTFSSTVAVSAGDTQSVAIPADTGGQDSGVAPADGEGTLLVTCAPRDASVTISGPGMTNEVLPCPVSTMLQAGSYDIEVAADGFETTSRSISIGAGDVSRATVELEAAGGSGFGIGIRATGGAGIPPDSSAVPAARASVFVPIDGAGMSYEIGIGARLGFGDEGVAVAGVLNASYVLALTESIGAPIGASLAYGTLGIPGCVGKEDIIDCDNSREDEASRFLYGGMLGLNVGIFEFLQVNAAADFLFASDVFVIDVHGGLSVVF